MIKSLTIFVLAIILAQEVAGKGHYYRGNSNLPAASDVEDDAHVEADAVVGDPGEYFEEEYSPRRKVRKRRGN